MRSTPAYELFHGILLGVIGFFCAAVGYVSRSSIDGLENDLTEDRLSLYFVYGLGIFAFLAYRQARKVSLMRQPGQSSLPLWLAAALCALGVFLTLLGMPDKAYHVAFVAVLFAPMATFCILSHLMLFRHSHTSAGASKFESFPNQVFIPAFVFCITTFAIGAHISSFDGNDPSLTTTVVLTGLQLSVIALYFFFPSLPDNILYFALPATTIAFATITYFLSGAALSIQVALAVLLTYLLGVAETAKNIHISFQESEIETEPDLRSRQLDRVKTYTAGANWSSIVFPILFLLAPVLYLDMGFLPTVFIVYTIVLTWLFLDQSTKQTKWGFWISLAFGYLTPIFVVLSFYYATLSSMENLAKVEQTQLLLALIGLASFSSALLRLTKDFAGIQLHKYVDGLWRLETYQTLTGNVMLLLLTNLLFCVLISAAWFALVVLGHFSNDATVLPENATGAGLQLQYGTRLVVAALASNILALLAVIIALCWPRQLTKLRSGADQINDYRPHAGAKS